MPNRRGPPGQLLDLNGYLVGWNSTVEQYGPHRHVAYRDPIHEDLRSAF